MVSSREKKCTTVIPETVFYFADTGPTAPLHGIFVLQQVKTGTLMSFFSGKPIKTEQIRDFPKFAVADGRITRRKCTTFMQRKPSEPVCNREKKKAARSRKGNGQLETSV